MLHVNQSKLGVITLVSLAYACLSCCAPSANCPPTQTPPAALPAGELVYVSQCCACAEADVRLLTLPGKESVAVLSDSRHDRELALSPDGQLLAVLSGVYQEGKYVGETLRVVDLPTRQVRLELPGFFLQFAWAANDANVLYYIIDDHEHPPSLRRYGLLAQESTLIAEDVSRFSVSPDGKWLGFPMRDPAYESLRFFYVLDLDSGRLLTTPRRSYLDELLYSPDYYTISVWSPTASEVAVFFYEGKRDTGVIIFAVHEDHLQVKATVTARETYQRDYDQDPMIADFSTLTWSPRGDKLLVTRPLPGTRSRRDALLFEADLSNYQRLPFEIVRSTWAEDRWLVYTWTNQRSPGSGPCEAPFPGEMWLADMETLETRRLVTDVVYIYPPMWLP